VRLTWATAVALIGSCESRPRQAAGTAAVAGPDAGGADAGVDAGRARLSPRALADHILHCDELYAARRWDELARACFAPKITSVAADSDEQSITGAAAEVAESQRTAEAFPDIHNPTALLLVHGDDTVSVAVLSGTNDGPLPTENGPGPITHRAIGVEFISLQNTDGTGLIDWELGYFNDTSTIGQLGLLPATIPFRPRAVAPPSPVIAVAQGDATEAANVAAHRAVADAWNRHDAAAVLAALAPALVWRDLTLPVDLDRAGRLRHLRAWWGGFSDAAITVDTLWGAGEYTFAAGRLRGTNDGTHASLGLRRSGRRFDVSYAEIDHWRDGAIDQVWFTYSRAKFADQLGLAPTRLP